MALARRDLSGSLLDGRYRVEYPLGNGGMGSVWSVQHVESLKHYALKTLAVDLAVQPAARERLLREARAGASLRSRHVVEVVDVQIGYVHDGEPLPYLVMERLEGLTLEQWLATRGPLAPGRLLWTMRQVGRALHLAHERGIVHRDVKPSNIFLTTDDEGAPITKLCDFGIAKLTPTARAHLLSSTGARTSKGDFLGTPLYLAPELLRGAGHATAAADQWALGLTAFRALTGKEYFHDATSGPELVLRIAQDPLPAPSRVAEGVPPAFDAWFLRSCERQPEQRFPSVADQVDALAAALAPAIAEPVALGRAAEGRAAEGRAAEGRAAGDPIVRSSAVGAESGAVGTSPLEASRGGQAAGDATRSARRRAVALAACVLWGLGATAWMLGLDSVGSDSPTAALEAQRPENPRSTAPDPAPASAASASPAASVPAHLPSATVASSASPAALTTAQHTTATRHPGTAQPAAPRPSNPQPTPKPTTVTAPSGSKADGAQSAPSKAPTTPTTGTPTGQDGLASGATCRRSAECASRLCLAERCR